MFDYWPISGDGTKKIFRFRSIFFFNGYVFRAVGGSICTRGLKGKKNKIKKIIIIILSHSISPRARLVLEALNMCWKMWASRLGGRTETTGGWHQVVAARRRQQSGEAGGCRRSVVAAEQRAEQASSR